MKVDMNKNYKIISLNLIFFYIKQNNLTKNNFLKN